jgi:CO dehydrogenase maturation factor
VKVVVAGKGGSGKTSISGTMARTLARAGRDVVAIDADSNPNLALTLGVEPELMDRVPTLPPDLIRRTPEGLKLTRTFEEVEESHALAAPDGVSLLVMALPKHADTGCLCSMHATVRMLIEAAPAGEDDVTILDTEASPEQFSRGTAMYADKMLAVVEPYFKSLETGRRMAALAKDLGIEDVKLVANKVRDERELGAVREFAETYGLEVGGVIPFDDRMPGSERASASPIDFDSDAEAVRAIGELAGRVAGDDTLSELVTSNGRGNGRA